MSTRSSIIISRSSAPRGGRIPGIFPSSRYGEQVVSSGIPSLDGFIGGGFPLGSVCILRDAYPSRFAELVLKCFVAEGSVYDHHVYVASDRTSPNTILEELPALKKVSQAGDKVNDSSHTDSPAALKIAWRYGATPGGPKVTKGQKEAKFEFKKKTTAAELGCKNVHTSRLFDGNDLRSPSSLDLLSEISEISKQFDSTNSLPLKQSRNVLRIAIVHCESQALNGNFLVNLRAIVRQTNSVCVLAVNDTQVGDSTDNLCDYLADYVINFEVFLSEGRKAELGDVDGVCDFVKLNSVHSLKPNEPPRDIGFCFRNKRLTFQELHIPPEGETTAQRETSKASLMSPPSASCGTVHKGKSIDF